jgi:hypothetical protein
MSSLHPSVPVSSLSERDAICDVEEAEELGAWAFARFNSDYSRMPRADAAFYSEISPNASRLRIRHQAGERRSFTGNKSRQCAGSPLLSSALRLFGSVYPRSSL